MERTGAAPPPCPRAAAVARAPSAPQGTKRPAADDTPRPRRLRGHRPKSRTLTWTTSMRSSGGRAPPRPDSISGRSAGRPLPLLSRSAPPRPALGGTRPGHAPRLGSSAWTPLSSGSLAVHQGRASGRRWEGGGRHSILPIKSAPLGWGRARPSSYVTAPKTSCQSKELLSLGGRVGGKQTGIRPPLDTACANHHGDPPSGLCGSHWSHSLAVIAASSWLRGAPPGTQERAGPSRRGL